MDARQVVDGIRTGKDTGLAPFPSHDFTADTALTAAMTGAVLLAWPKLLAPDGHLAKGEPAAGGHHSCAAHVTFRK